MIYRHALDASGEKGCGYACPFVKAKRREDWQIPDPKHMEPDEFRKVRDFIKGKIQGLLAEMA